MRKIVINLILMTFSAFLVLTAAEILLRFGLINNPQFGRYQLKGDLDQPELKVLVLGDSFIQWDGELSALLSDSFDKKQVQMLNLAIGGVGPYEYLEQIKTAGRFSPDIVLLSYYAGNDFTNVKNYPFAKQHSQSDLKKDIRSLLHRSYLVQLFKKAYASIKLRKLFQSLEEHYDDENLLRMARSGEINPWLIKTAAENPDYLTDNILMQGEVNEKVWTRSREILLEIKRVSELKGAELRIVIFPATVQIDRSHFAIYKKLGLNINEALLTDDKPQELFQTFCSEYHIPCLDFLPKFRQLKDKQLYLPNDTHLNSDGNRISAAQISDFVLSEA